MPVPCKDENSLWLAGIWVDLITPYYAVTAISVAVLGTIAFGMYRGIVSAPPVIRAIVAFSLVGLVGYAVWRINDDRNNITRLTGSAACDPMSKR